MQLSKHGLSGCKEQRGQRHTPMHTRSHTCGTLSKQAAKSAEVTAGRPWLSTRWSGCGNVALSHCEKRATKEPPSTAPCSRGRSGGEGAWAGGDGGAAAGVQQVDRSTPQPRAKPPPIRRIPTPFAFFSQQTLLQQRQRTLPQVMDPPRNATVMGAPASSLCPSRCMRRPEP